MARRQPRLAAQVAAASMRTTIPNISDNEDDEMVDAPVEDAPTPVEDDDEPNNDSENQEDQDDADNAQSPAPESEPPSRSATPRRSGRPTALLPRKRRLGRPPKIRPVNSDDDGADPTSDVGTPKRRGGFRGGRGGRWGKPRGGPSHVTQVPIDREGNTLDVIDDEVNLPEDPEGETKVDKMGHLQDGREYRVRTFTIIGRGKRLYMLSTEPARCIGFRDSYLFFQKHKLLYKIIIDDEEKRDLIERDLIPHSYKGRAIGVVTARSVFREFGAKIVIGGKKIIDDYDILAAKERGDVEGELAVPEDRIPPPGESYNRNQYVAWHGASSVYHTGAPSVPQTSGKIVDGKRKKITVTSDNWMLEHAREASRFNGQLANSRLDVFNGLYDIHTNQVQFPSATQPTHARWEAVESQENPIVPKGKLLTNGVGTIPDDAMVMRPTNLPSLDPIYTRNFRIHDTHLETAPDSTLGAPGIDADMKSLSIIQQTILDELPAECLEAFEEAKDRELEWRSRFLNESRDGKRAHFVPTTLWFT